MSILGIFSKRIREIELENKLFKVDNDALHQSLNYFSYEKIDKLEAELLDWKDIAGIGKSQYDGMEQENKALKEKLEEINSIIPSNADTGVEGAVRKILGDKNKLHQFHQP